MIRKKATGRVRIALHGTNDFPEATMKRCIAGGVSKVNVNKLVLDDYLVHLGQNASKLGLTTLMEQGVRETEAHGVADECLWVNRKGGDR